MRTHYHDHQYPVREISEEQFQWVLKNCKKINLLWTIRRPASSTIENYRIQFKDEQEFIHFTLRWT